MEVLLWSAEDVDVQVLELVNAVKDIAGFDADVLVSSVVVMKVNEGEEAINVAVELEMVDETLISWVTGVP